MLLTVRKRGRGGVVPLCSGTEKRQSRPGVCRHLEKLSSGWRRHLSGRGCVFVAAGEVGYLAGGIGLRHSVSTQSDWKIIF